MVFNYSQSRSYFRNPIVSLNILIGGVLRMFLKITIQIFFIWKYHVFFKVGLKKGDNQLAAGKLEFETNINDTLRIYSKHLDVIEGYKYERPTRQKHRTT